MERLEDVLREHGVLAAIAELGLDAGKVFGGEPDRDDGHPPLSFGKRRFVIDDPDMRSWLLRR